MSNNRYHRSRFWGIDAQLDPRLALFIRMLPFILLLASYVIVAEIKYAENPDEKIVPTVEKMIEGMTEKITVRDIATGTYLFWNDTLASVTRLVIGVALAAWVGFFLGLNMGMLPVIQEFLLSFIVFLSFIPPLSILPILLIVLGVGEVAKIGLIFIGTVPFISCDVYLAVKAIPTEMKVKAQTLGASSFGIAYRVVTPQILPRLIESVCLTLGAAWTFLLAGEYIGSVDGLGYRIFISMRYLGMNIIIPYVLWITFLAFFFYWSLRQVSKRNFKWYLTANKGR